MRRLVPAPRDPLVDRFDQQLLATPDVALDNVARVLEQVSDRLLHSVDELVSGRPLSGGQVQDIGRHLDAVHRFVDQIQLQAGQTQAWQRLNATFHLLDHLQRLHERCEEEPERGMRLPATLLLAAPAMRFHTQLTATTTALQRRALDLAEQTSAAAAAEMRQQAGDLRAAIMADVAGGRLDVPAGTGCVESVRWLRRVSYHVWRVTHYTSVLAQAGPDHRSASASIRSVRSA
jgi:phosphate:Na+ symporter